MIRSLLSVVRNLVLREQGQDLVEYALVVALIAFGSITGMGYLAAGIKHCFLRHLDDPYEQRLRTSSPDHTNARPRPGVPVSPDRVTSLQRL